MDGRAAKKQRTEPRAPVVVTRHSDIAVHARLHECIQFMVTAGSVQIRESRH